MNESEARAQIVMLAQAAVYPTLSTQQVDYLVRKARIVDANGRPPDPYRGWQASAGYSEGETVVPDPRNGHCYVAESAGTTGSGIPAWPTGSGQTVSDGGVTWRESGPAPWEGSWNIAYAVALGWELKAGEAAAEYDFGSAGQQFNRSQVREMCLEQAKAWRRKAGIVTVETPARTGSDLQIMETLV